MAKWNITCPSCGANVWMSYEGPLKRPEARCEACGNLIAIHDGRPVVKVGDGHPDVPLREAIW